jgi:hypothetical protein
MKVRVQTGTEGRLCEHSEKQPTASQGQRPQKRPTLLTPHSQTSGLRTVT